MNVSSRFVVLLNLTAASTLMVLLSVRFDWL
ncbi:MULTISPECIES: stress response membrane protein YncL [Enterobacteriaceae]|jgi:hypothetical protein|nr:stress response membrane protein YncL [Lelliottia sp. WAP21]